MGLAAFLNEFADVPRLIPLGDLDRKIPSEESPIRPRNGDPHSVPETSSVHRLFSFLLGIDRDLAGEARALGQCC
jgi:hypothetical protein